MNFNSNKSSTSIPSRSVAGGKGGRPTAASLPSRDRHSVFTQRKQNMPLLWLRIPLHDIGGARMWMSCLPRCSLKCQASWGERGLRAGSAYLPSSPLHLIVAAKNAWQRLERGEEYRQLVESGCFGKISTFRMCGVKRGGGWARAIAGKSTFLHGPHKVHPRWSGGRCPHVERWLMAWIVLVATAPSSMHQTAQLKSWKQTRSKTIRRSWVTVFSTGKEVRLQLPRPGEGRRQTTLQKKTKIPASLIHPKMFCVKTVRF